MCLHLFRDSGKVNENNLSKKKHLALKNLIKNRDLIIQKADKGNTVVTLNKNNYISKIKVILNVSSKFQKPSIDQSKVLNHIVHMENRIIDVLKKLTSKKVISEKKYENLHPVGSSPAILYGRAKIHKPVKDDIPSFRPILSALGTPTYKLSKFFVPLLTPLSLNEYTIKDSFSFDVESLFTNIPLQETVDLCVKLLFNDKSNIDGFTITDFHELLTITMSESLVLFDGEYYKRIDGVAMGSPLGPTFAKIFLSYHEQILLKNCPCEFKPAIYRRYVDGTFLLFR